MKGRKLWKANILIFRDINIKTFKFNPLAIKQNFLWRLRMAIGIKIYRNIHIYVLSFTLNWLRVDL